MDHPKAHGIDIEQQKLEAWRRVDAGVRELTEDVFIPGLGCRRIQLVYAPSLKPGYSWDLRELNNVYRLYFSKIVMEGDQRQRKLSGYGELEVDIETLMHFVGKLSTIAIPIAPDLSGIRGFDGTLYQLGFFGDLRSEVRFQWWEEGPAHWQSLIAIADEMVNGFLHLLPKPRGQQAS